MSKENIKIIKIALSILVGIVGLLTVIFAILKLANVKGSVDPSVILQILTGVALTIIGTATALITIFTNAASKAFNLITSSLLLGLGIYLFIDDTALNTVVGLIFPIIVACFGGLLLIKGIVDCVNKNNKFILNMIVGACLLVVGILFAVYSNVLTKVVWLLLGLAIITVSVGYIVIVIGKKPKAKIINSNKE